MATRRHGDRYIDPETWYRTAPKRDGVWWGEWSKWLAEHSTSRLAPPAMGAAAAGLRLLDDAPGTYVRGR